MKKTKVNNGTAVAVETQPINIQHEETFEKPSELDNPLRIVIVINSSEKLDGDLQQRLMDYVQTMDEVDEFFNEFDDAIAIPNDGHIKYEVGSDGLVVIMVDTIELRDLALKFIDEYNEKLVQS